MGNPYDVPYVVQPEEAPLEYNHECYQAGDCIMVKQNDIGCFMDPIYPEPPVDCCFPEYCVGDNGVPFAGYRVPFTIPPGECIVLPIPILEGCAPPGSVRFFYCSSCLYLGIDGDPITDPTDPVAMSGGGGYPNPTMIDLNGCESTLHLCTADSVPVDGMLMFYC